MTYKTIIIEDELNNQKLLKTTLTIHCPEIDVIDICETVELAHKSIYNHKPDLLLLDIELKDGTGFDLLQRLEQPLPYVIFITAYDEYAIKAFKFSAVDYLLKPIEADELKAAVEKIPDLSIKTSNENLAVALKNILTKEEDPLIRIPSVSDITYVKVSEVVRLVGEGAYCHLICQDGTKFTLSKTLKDFESLLDDYNFVRAHQSHIINLRYAYKYKKGEQVVILRNGTQVPIARNRKELFLKRMNKLSLL